MPYGLLYLTEPKILSMKLSPHQLDHMVLAQFGWEAVELVESKNFARLAERFGYALAFGRNIEAAIEADFHRCLLEASESSSKPTKSVQVKYFGPNKITLYAVIECVIPVNPNTAVLVELIVTGVDVKYITLEDISCISWR